MFLRIGPALLAKFRYTFALVYVVLNSATAKGTYDIRLTECY